MTLSDYIVLCYLVCSIVTIIVWPASIKSCHVSQKIKRDSHKKKNRMYSICVCESETPTERFWTKQNKTELKNPTRQTPTHTHNWLMKHWFSFFFRIWIKMKWTLTFFSSSIFYSESQFISPPDQVCLNIHARINTSCINGLLIIPNWND